MRGDSRGSDCSLPGGGLTTRTVSASLVNAEEYEELELLRALLDMFLEKVKFDGVVLDEEN